MANNHCQKYVYITLTIHIGGFKRLRIKKNLLGAKCSGFLTLSKVAWVFGCEYEPRSHEFIYLWIQLWFYVCKSQVCGYKQKSVEIMSPGQVTREIKWTPIAPDGWQQWSWCCQLRLNITGKASRVFIQPFFHMMSLFWCHFIITYIFFLCFWCVCMKKISYFGQDGPRVCK